MKKILGFIFILSTTTTMLSQEKFRKAYWIPEKIIYESTDLHLKEEVEIRYSDLDVKKKEEKSLKEKIDKLYPIGKIITVVKKSPTSPSFTYYEDITVSVKFLNNLKLTIPKNTDDNIHRGYAKLIKNKLIINAWLTDKPKEVDALNNLDIDSDSYNNNHLKKDVLVKGNEDLDSIKNEKDKWSRKTYYYELKNRQVVNLHFDEFFISAITIPFKYRFKDNKGENEDFSASINLNAFLGYSWGWTKFMYRKDIDNLERETRFMFGGFLGSSVVELNNSNTENLSEGQKYNRGVISYGAGVGWSAGKFQVAFLYGWDNAIGSKSEDWNFNGQPWIGAGIGFELIK